MFVMNVPSEYLDEGVINAFKEEVQARGLDNVILSNVEEIIKSAKQGEVVKIGGLASEEDEAQPVQEPREVEEKIEKQVDLSSLPFAITVTSDRMQAVLEMLNPSVSIDRGHIDAAFERLGIVHGIQEEKIEKLLAEWPRIYRLTVALGTLPEPGGDARLELMKQVKDNMAPTVTEEGTVDFKHLDLISTIEAGEVLEVRSPPTPGAHGSDVFGREIPSQPGRDRKFRRGQNTHISDDGTKLISSLSGFIHLGKNGEINVQPVYTIQSDVDYSTGNVDYKGDVLVKGDIRAGFAVRAGGDVHVYGAVEDALVQAGGNVTINGGVLSSGKAMVRAGKDVSVGFLEHAAVEAGGSVFIRIEAVWSRIKAGKDVEVTKPNGRIVNTELTLGGWVVAPVIGSENSQMLRVRFEGNPDGVADPDARYRFCFLSTRSLESGVIVQFGMFRTNVPRSRAPTTILLRDGNVVVEQRFVKSKELASLRKQQG